MPPNGVESTKRLLEESMQQIAQIPAGKAEEGVSSFNSLRRAVTHASSGIGASPEELLDDLEPKGKVLAFLVELYDKKKMYRKQIAAVVASLVQVDRWLCALKADTELCSQLPEELGTLIQDAEPAAAAPAKEAATDDAPRTLPTPEPPKAPSTLPLPASAPSKPQAAGPTPAQGAYNPFADPGPKPGGYPVSQPPPPKGPEPPSELDVRKAISAAQAKATSSTNEFAGPPTATTPAGSPQVKGDITVALGLLETGKNKMQALNYNAAKTDEAGSAFEAFRKGVQMVVRSPSKEDDDVLEKLEPKGKVLEFLVDFYERRRLYRARIAASLSQLLNYEGWAQAAEDDPSVQAAVREFTVQPDAPPTNTFSAVKPKADGCEVYNLRAAAAKSAEQGGAGVLYVRVVAAYNLINTDRVGCSDPYVRVSFGEKMKRTEVIADCLNPRWDATPFIFDVQDLSWNVFFEVLDSDFMKTDPLGSLCIPLSEVPTRPGQPAIRRSLTGVPTGELEFEVMFAQAEQGGEGPPKQSAAGRPTLTPWDQPAAPAPRAGKTPWDPPGPPTASPTPSAPSDAGTRRPTAASAYPSASSTPGKPYSAGQALEYWSMSQKKWVPCKVDSTKPSGEVTLNVKPGLWLSLEEQANKLRIPEPSKFTTGQQLEYFSSSANRWIPCTVQAVDPYGKVELSVKKGVWLSREDQGENKLRAAGATTERTAAVQPAEQGTCWVAWVSVDPRSGDIKTYPGPICQQLEAGFQSGEPFVQLPDAFRGAKVSFKPVPVQRTERGSRDVRRIELAEPNASVALHIVKKNDWRVADPSGSLGSQERRAQIPAGVAVPASRVRL